MKKTGVALYTVRFIALAALMVATILVFSVMFKGLLDARSNDTVTSGLPKIDRGVLIIDAGHGGEDAGAVASDGTLEKDLNLQIASLIKVLCDLNGTKAVMTRTEDTLLYDYYDDLEDYTGQKKLYDLKNRVKIANEYEGAVYLGIHMNKFSIPKYSGTQVYFSPNNSSSELFARCVQNQARTHLQPSNNRTVKRADSSIYVLNSLLCPAILVECGFLSNEAELECLKSSDYQARLALVLFSSSLAQL